LKELSKLDRVMRIKKRLVEVEVMNGNSERDFKYGWFLLRG
jgi:hypothetical protein